MARMSCISDVSKEHVKEAYRLLNKSIIRVEEPDIDLDEPELGDLPEDPAPADDEMNETPEHPSEPAVQKKKITITFETYKSISNLIVMYLRRQEALDESKQS